MPDLTITDLVCYPMQAPGRTVVAIEVKTKSGLSGIGEAGLQRRPMAVSGVVESLKRVLIGQDGSRIEYLWQKVFRGGFYPADKIVGSTLAAIDMALWDIKGKAVDLPVYELMGGRSRDYIDCYPHLPPSHVSGGTDRDQQSSHDELIAQCQSARDAGWRFVRLHPRDDNGVMRSRQAALELLSEVAAVREAVGNDIEVTIDLHTRLDPPDAVWFCKAVEQYQPFFVEDPFRSENSVPYQRLREQSSVPIAAGEQFSSKWDFRPLIEQELIDYARIDLCIAGGLTEARKIAGWAEAHYIEIVPHNPLGPVSTAAGVQLGLVIPNFAVQELPWEPGVMLPDVFTWHIPYDAGRFYPTDAPGLGLSFNAEAALEHPFAFTEPPHFHRPDGSFTSQ